MEEPGIGMGIGIVALNVIAWRSELNGVTGLVGWISLSIAEEVGGWRPEYAA